MEILLWLCCCNCFVQSYPLFQFLTVHSSAPSVICLFLSQICSFSHWNIICIKLIKELFVAMWPSAPFVFLYTRKFHYIRTDRLLGYKVLMIHTKQMETIIIKPYLEFGKRWKLMTSNFFEFVASTNRQLLHCFFKSSLRNLVPLISVQNKIFLCDLSYTFFVTAFRICQSWNVKHRNLHVVL